MLGKALGYQAKLQKHLAAGDKERVRDYMANIVMEWPDLKQCPIDLDLLKKAMAFVQTGFSFNPKAKTVKDVFVRK